MRQAGLRSLRGAPRVMEGPGPASDFPAQWPEPNCCAPALPPYYPCPGQRVSPCACTSAKPGDGTSGKSEAVEG